MPIIKKIVNRDIFKNFEIPEEFGEEFEMILSPINDSKSNKKMIDIQSKNGFLNNILIQESEDVWNDI